jgi:hypothetical protein
MSLKSRKLVTLIAIGGYLLAGRTVAARADGGNMEVVGQGVNANLATAIANAGSSGTVIVPIGYAETITSAVLVSQSNLTIQCQSGSSLTLGVSLGAPSFPGTAVGMITVQPGGSLAMDGCNLLSSNNNNPSGFVGSLLVAQSGAGAVTLTNNTFSNCYYYCAYLIDLPSGTIRGNHFSGGRSDAITLIGNATNITIDSNSCDATGIAASPQHKCIDAHASFGLITGKTSTSSLQITSVTDIADIAVGDTLTSTGLPEGTTVTAVPPTTPVNTITVSQYPLVSATGVVMTLPSIRQITNLTITNNDMTTGNGFCTEIGDFGGQAPTGVTFRGNHCTAANLATLAPIASFNGTTTEGSNMITVSSTTGIALNQNLRGPGIANGSVVTGISGSTVTVSQRATSTVTDQPMTTSSGFGGFSFQNVQSLNMCDNSFSNTTGSGASPGAIEIVGDSSTPYIVGAGPAKIVNATLVGGGISIDTTSNVSISGVQIQLAYPLFPNVTGAININSSNHITLSGSTVDMTGVGPTGHAGVYDICNHAGDSCSNLQVSNLTILDDGQSTEAAYHIGFSQGSDMGAISIMGGQVHGFTHPGAAAYFLNHAVTDITIEGVDDSGNAELFNPAGQTPGPGNPQLTYTP